MTILRLLRRCGLVCLFAIFGVGSLVAGDLPLPSSKIDMNVELRGLGPNDDWPQWLGPNRDGISHEIGIQTTWPPEGPKILWRIPLGEGYSGVSVSDGKVFTLFSAADDEFLVALDATTGKESWRVRTDSTYKDTNGNGPRSTPTIHGELIYALSGRGKLYAFEAENGKTHWQQDLRKDFRSYGPSDGGFSTSPLVEGDLLLVEAGGGNGNAFVGFNKKTGQVVWKVESDSAAFSSPIGITIGSLRQIIFFSAEGLVSLSPKDGRVFWRLPWKTAYNVNAATPLFITPDRLFISSGYETGSALLRLQVQSGNAAMEEIWRTKKIQNIFSTSIVQGEYLYGFDKSSLKCIQIATGEEKWLQRGFGVGSLIYADGHLIVLGDKGKLAMAEATPESYNEKAIAEIMEGRCITVPAFANGKLYLRNTKEVVCVELAEGK